MMTLIEKTSNSEFPSKYSFILFTNRLIGLEPVESTRMKLSGESSPFGDSIILTAPCKLQQIFKI